MALLKRSRVTSLLAGAAVTCVGCSIVLDPGGFGRNRGDGGMDAAMDATVQMDAAVRVDAAMDAAIRVDAAMDASLFVDSGADSGVDSGADSGIDSGPDSGPADSGPVDSGPPDAGPAPTNCREEAPRFLDLLFRLAVVYFSPGGCLTASAQSSNLPRPAATPMDWSTEAEPFRWLGFVGPNPAYCQYEIVSQHGCGHSGNEVLYSFYAMGDLDGDGVTSLFEITGNTDMRGILQRSTLRSVMPTE